MNLRPSISLVLVCALLVGASLLHRPCVQREARQRRAEAFSAAPAVPLPECPPVVCESTPVQAPETETPAGLEGLIGRLEVLREKGGPALAGPACWLARSDCWAAVSEVEDEILFEIGRDDASLDRLLARFRVEEDPVLAEWLSVPLGLLPVPRTEQAALEVARWGRTEGKRLLALDLLLRLGSSLEGTPRALAGIVRIDPSQAVVQGAISCLPPRSSEDAEVRHALEEALGSPDEETRRRAAVALGDARGR